MNEEINNENAETAVAPTVADAETAQVRKPFSVRKDRNAHEWAEVWCDDKIVRVRIDLVSAMTLDRQTAPSEDGEEDVVQVTPYIHLAGGKDVIRINETSWTALNDYLLAAVE